MTPAAVAVGRPVAGPRCRDERSSSRVAEFPDLRSGKLARGVLLLLESAPDGLARTELVAQMAASVPPTALELRESAKAIGVRQYDEAIQRSTAPLVRAGWLTKSADVWSVTEKGQRALARFQDPLAFYHAAVSRRDWELHDGKPASDVGDVFAGCFLSIAGSLVGAIVGTVVLLARMWPDPTVGLIGGFAAGFIVGVVVGFVASFFIADLALRIGRGVENIWLGGTAVVAAAAAALAPSLLIAADAAR